MTVLSLTDAKTALNINTTTYDGELPNYINSAIEAVESICGSMSVTSFTDVVRGCGTLTLTNTPVVALTSVTGEWMGALDVSLLAVSDTGVVRAIRGTYLILDDWYTVVYTAGRSTVPASATAAAIVYLKWMWATRRGNSARPSQGGDDLTNVPGLGLVPARFVELLDPIRLGPSVG